MTEAVDTAAPTDVCARLHRLERQLAQIQRLAQFGSWEWDIAKNVVTSSDELYRICGVAIDVTERRRSEQFLREFIGNASHALGTPAAVIMQAAHVLADDALGAKDHEAAMGALLRQSKRLHDLSTNLFDLVALDKGAPSVMLGLSIMLGPVALADRVRKAAAAIPPADGATPTIDITIDIAADIAVLAEPSELERVFVNLLDNAQTHGGPNVSVTASRLADEVIVDVRDDGAGVPDDHLQDLFAPFAKRQTAGQGPGLGLAIVHQLMVAFGGAVSYHRAKPHGSVFTLRFSVD
ncbi:MAG TPA: HAMP domain-containing sensor histidine kinase [Dermatophilaceae bacterium]